MLDRDLTTVLDPKLSASIAANKGDEDKSEFETPAVDDERLQWIVDQFGSSFELAEEACALRERQWSQNIALRCWPEYIPVPPQQLCPWPEEAEIGPVFRPKNPVELVVTIDSKEQRWAFLDELRSWVLRSTMFPTRVAVYSSSPSSTQHTWLIAAARLLLPPTTRIEARFDRIGLRIAQLALNYGADSLGGPFAAARHLPIAGVSRPNENTLQSLCDLVEQAGLCPSLPSHLQNHGAKLDLTAEVVEAVEAAEEDFQSLADTDPEELSDDQSAEPLAEPLTDSPDTCGEQSAHDDSEAPLKESPEAAPADEPDAKASETSAETSETDAEASETDAETSGPNAEASGPDAEAAVPDAEASGPDDTSNKDPADAPTSIAEVKKASK